MAFLGGIFNQEINQCQRKCKSSLVGLPDDVIKACTKACKDNPSLDPYLYVDSLPQDQRYWEAEGMIMDQIQNDQDDNSTLIIGLVVLALVGILVYNFLKK